MATVSLYQMRIDIANCYPYSKSESWRRQVINSFSDNKIVAMYHDFLRRDKFRQGRLQKQIDEASSERTEQINFFDEIGGSENVL